MQKAKTAIAALLLVLLVGCKGVGHGNKPDSMVIEQTLDEPAGTVAKAFTCVPAQLLLVGTFSHGDRGDFSFRAKWTSSDPDIVKVTNFGEPSIQDPTQQFLTGGTLLPIRAVPEGGSDPIITAEYLGFKSSIQVHVKPSTNVGIIPPKQIVAPGSFQIIHLTADTDDGTQEITSTATFAFDQPNDAVATVDTEAEVISIAATAPAATGELGSPGNPLIVRATPTVPCLQEPNITASYSVADVPEGGLRLDYQKDFYGPADSPGFLAENTSQLLQFAAHFGDVNGNGTEDPEEVEDLTGQAASQLSFDVDHDGTCEFANEGTAVDLTAPVLFGGLLGGLNTVVALPDDPDDGLDETVNLCGGFGIGTDPDGTGPLFTLPRYQSPLLPLTVKDAVVTDFQVSRTDVCNTADTGTCTPLDDPLLPDPVPDGATIPILTGQAFRLTAHGTFTHDYHQDITKDVSLTTTNSSVLQAVAGRSTSAGLVATLTLPSFEGVDDCDPGTGTVPTTCPVDLVVVFSQGDDDITNDVTKTFHFAVTIAPTDP